MISKKWRISAGKIDGNLVRKQKSGYFCATLKLSVLDNASIEGTLAQLVEQWTENPCVPGSIPGGTTSISIG